MDFLVEGSQFLETSSASVLSIKPCSPLSGLLEKGSQLIVSPFVLLLGFLSLPRVSSLCLYPCLRVLSLKSICLWCLNLWPWVCHFCRLLFAFFHWTRNKEMNCEKGKCLLIFLISFSKTLKQDGLFIVYEKAYEPEGNNTSNWMYLSINLQPRTLKMSVLGKYE